MMMEVPILSKRRQLLQPRHHQRSVAFLMILAHTLFMSSHGYTVPPSQQPISPAFTQSRSHLAKVALSVSTSSAASPDFDAFADSLEIDDSEAGSSSPSSTTTKSTEGSGTKFQAEVNASLNKTWQAKFEEMLDPTTNVADRQILLSDLLNSNQEIRDSVLDALSNRNLDPLLTPSQKKFQEGTRAVVRQLTNDILPQITKTAATATSRVGPPSPLGSSSESSSSSLVSPPVSPSDLQSIGNRLFSVFSNQLQRNFADLQDDLSDPFNKIPQRLSKQTEEVIQEAKNVFLETPEGLKEPVYTVVESCDLYEIRDYEGYSVASTAMGKDSDGASMDGVMAGSAFNVLAAYLFGDNEEKKSMSMTTPVTTTSSGEMRFYLAEPAGRIPKPSSGKDNLDRSVEIVDIPPARLAVRKFTGFVTDGEIARQKDVLLQALSIDGVELDVAHGAIVPHIVFQYNPPYTLPMVRRNEIAVPVRNSEAEPVKSLQNEWSVDAEDDDGEFEDSSVNGLDDVAPSD